MTEQEFIENCYYLYRPIGKKERHIVDNMASIIYQLTLQLEQLGIDGLKCCANCKYAKYDTDNSTWVCTNDSHYQTGFRGVLYDGSGKCDNWEIRDADK